MSEQFKLTEEMIAEIEEKINKALIDARSGMKQRLVDAGCYTEGSFITVCEIVVGIDDERVNVIDPIQTCDEEEEIEDDGDFY